MRPAIAVAAAALLWTAAAAQSPAKDLEVARGVLESALKDHPKNAELHTLLGFVFRKMDRLEDSEKSFSKAVSANPGKAEAHFMLGMIREKAGRTKEALASWRACLEAAKEDGMRETARKHVARLEASER